MRVDRIIEAALDQAEEHGVPGVTTASLAHRLEFTEAALYRYFPGKGAILAAALDYLTERLLATMLLELMPESAGTFGVEFQLDRHIRRFACATACCSNWCSMPPAVARSPCRNPAPRSCHAMTPT